ncbi:putative Peroxidase 48 [Eutrema salsugineum]|uniref:putative Peroxidase 48 n=1 Tax=Eutrema salsugineum TaxID=72664 RepID=UPI000CED008E|nr:putative Peroxidase 48 [Eutrema salsugineum]
MRFIGDWKIAFATCFFIALSIYVARLEFDNVVLHFLRLAKDFPENHTGGKVSEKSPYEEDFMTMFMSTAEDIDRSYSLHYDFYQESCPSAERIIAKAITETYNARPSIAPSLIRLLFHDCFIEGCDASVLLDADESLTSEKEASPNQSLKGLDVIDAIKSELENVCPGVVSCADIIVLAAREAVLLAGGPFYPLETGRKDSVAAFKEIAERELPTPQANLSVILARFASRGFNERETVSLFGAHSIGTTHCTFFEDRLYNFAGTGKPDPELNPGFLQELKTKCPFSASASSPSPSPGTGLAPSLPASDCPKNYGMSPTGGNDGVIDLSFNNEGGEENFGTRYFRRLMQKKGLLFSDQQLTSSEETETWVRAYASDPQLFRRDFAMSMMKLSSYHVLTGPLGQVRTTCSKVLPKELI